MSLIATARALDDQRFIWRCRAALLKVASLRKASALSYEVEYAEYILRNPLQSSPVLESLCAVDPAIGAATVVDEANAVNTEAVKDETLMYIAEVNFTWLAEQYVSGDLYNESNQQFVGAVGGVATGF